jgi:hypothetical protein
MKLRHLFLGTATLLLAVSAGAQTVYDDDREMERRDIYQRDVDMDRGDVRRAVDMRRDQMDREARSLPPRVIKMDVAEVDEKADRSFRHQTLGRKLGASDWQELRRQRSEIDDLKDRIRAGQSVSPSAVDRALGYDDQLRVGY